MTYNADPLQKVLDRQFVREGDEYHFWVGGLEGTLPVSEEEVFSAEQTLRDYSSKAKFVGFVFIAPVMTWLYWTMIAGRPMAVPIIIGVAVAFGAPFILSLVAIELALRPFKLRLRAHQRQQPGWKPKGWLRAIRDLDVPLPSLALAVAILLVLLPYRLIELKNRADILDHGIPVTARVTKSDDSNGKHTCVVEFDYNWNGQKQSGKTIGCELMKSHPVGSRISAKILPTKPEYSIAEGEGLWTADVAGPLIVILLFGLTIPGIAMSARSYAPRH